MFENKNKFILCVDKDDLAYYADLSEHNILRGKNREKFIFAMVYGYKNKADIPLDNRDSGGYWRFFESDPISRALVFSVSFNDMQDLKINSESDLWGIIHKAEEYAHGGIRLLKNRWENVPHSSYWNKLEEGLFDEINNTHLSKENY